MPTYLAREEDRAYWWEITDEMLSEFADWDELSGEERARLLLNAFRGNGEQLPVILKAKVTDNFWDYRHLELHAIVARNSVRQFIDSTTRKCSTIS
jgi:hypothetical protein